MAKLSHIDASNRPAMVDVGDKTASKREARAQSIVLLPPAVLDALQGDDIASKKGTRCSQRRSSPASWPRKRPTN